jgi:hypothetical protein
LSATKTLRGYQLEKANEGFEILKANKIVYLAMAVRTGKTATALQIAKLMNAKNVLFATKKKAITSIEKDYLDFGYSSYFDLVVINDESLHLVPNLNTFDLVIHDENHRFGSFPKPNKVASFWKTNFKSKPQIWLSGTPNPESYSQIFHQLWISESTPFVETNFYKWSKNYVNVTQKRIGVHSVNDYSDANKELINSKVKHLFVKLTQEEAGFESNIIESIINIESKALGYLIKLIKKERLINNEILEEKGSNLRINGEIVADTPAKLMQKIHQISGGTCLNEVRGVAFIDYSRAKEIKRLFEGKKIVIFYQFKAELDAIKQIYKDEVTTDLTEFNNTSKSIALQLVSGREGINLSKATDIVYYNLSFSAVTYWQSRDRMTTINRAVNNIHFVCLKSGMESHILTCISRKKPFTLDVFKKEML